MQKGLLFLFDEEVHTPIKQIRELIVMEGKSIVEISIRLSVANQVTRRYVRPITSDIAIISWDITLKLEDPLLKLYK